jgi:hypothetical protein
MQQMFSYQLIKNFFQVTGDKFEATVYESTDWSNITYPTSLDKLHIMTVVNNINHYFMADERFSGKLEIFPKLCITSRIFGKFSSVQTGMYRSFDHFVKPVLQVAINLILRSNLTICNEGNNWITIGQLSELNDFCNFPTFSEASNYSYLQGRPPGLFNTLKAYKKC